MEGIAVYGRVMGLRSEVHADGSGVRIRIDSDRDHAFWLEVQITPEALQDLLRRVAQS